MKNITATAPRISEDPKTAWEVMSSSFGGRRIVRLAGRGSIHRSQSVKKKLLSERYFVAHSEYSRFVVESDIARMREEMP